VVNLQVELLVREVLTKLLSHASNGATEETWPLHDVATESCWRWRCRDDVGRGAMSLLCHAGDDTAELTVVPRCWHFLATK
jgi:hypothetical protein